MRGLDGKVAFVTGAACPPGMGGATARRLAEEGALVACVERIETPDSQGELPDTACASADALDEVVSAIRSAGGRAIAVHADVSDPEQLARAVAQTVEQLGRLDLCVNACGGLGPELGAGTLMEISDASFLRCVDINFTAAWRVARACAERMIASGNGGSIVLVSSWAAHRTHANTSVFCSAKLGVDRLVHSLAWELGPQRIRVNGVRPLAVDPEAGGGNPFLERISGRDPGKTSWASEHIALGRLQTPAELASVAAFLLSDEASFVTGELIDVSGAGYL